MELVIRYRADAAGYRVRDFAGQGGLDRSIVHRGGREGRGRASQYIAGDWLHVEIGCHAVRLLVVDQNDEVGDLTLGAVRRPGNELGGGLTGLLNAHHGRAAAVETNSRGAAACDHLFSQCIGVEAATVRGLTIDLEDDDRAVSLGADRRAGTVCGCTVNGGWSSLTVCDQRLAADCVLDLIPALHHGVEGDGQLFADRIVNPGRLAVIALGENHLVFTDGEGLRAADLADDLELCRMSDAQIVLVLIFQNDALAGGGEAGLTVIVGVEQIEADRSTGLVVAVHTDVARRTGNRNGAYRRADDCRAVCTEANRILPGVARDNTAIVHDQTGRNTVFGREEVGVDAADDIIALTFQTGNHLRQGDLVAIELGTRAHTHGSDRRRRGVLDGVGTLGAGGVYGIGIGIGCTGTNPIRVGEPTINQGGTRRTYEQNGG